MRVTLTKRLALSCVCLVSLVSLNLVHSRMFDTISNDYVYKSLDMTCYEGVDPFGACLTGLEKLDGNQMGTAAND